jgi:hypothetical protein
MTGSFRAVCGQMRVSAETACESVHKTVPRNRRKRGHGRCRPVHPAHHLLADPEARFTDLGVGWHDEQAGRDRKIRSHLRQLKALGVEVTIDTTAA